ncbi:MAG: transposase [Bacteroidales bacterium]|nr:transposase [Bacteroidales bacterium]
MDKYRGKYRISSTRLQNWNYRWDAAYFITICTKQRKCYFGEVVNGSMYLSNIGILADVFWYEIKNHAKNLELGAFVVMPNHVHGILILDGNNKTPTHDPTVETTHDAIVETTHDATVETTHALSLPHPPPPKTHGQKRFQHQGANTVSSIIGSYKSAVSKHAHRLGFEFGWQSRFDDRIIRDDLAYKTITNYIINNPQKWHDDRFNPENPDVGQ